MIITVQNDTFDLTGGLYSLRGQVITFFLSNGKVIPYNYISSSAALTAFQQLNSETGANGVSIASVTPNTYVGSVGATLTVVGTGFISTCQAEIGDSSGVLVGGTTNFVSSTTFQLVISNPVTAGVYNMFYTDSTGACVCLPSSIIVT